ncbi:hypothetical protein ElyMa_003815400 [Elysia marginata]|uniref:Uncharacterized protein n=1 Tax=Elysia marginata TaxID=1093978 RepID=A0AAV4FDZ6_9GAST|nr:hypothetical protein ElyMa_003815400 [Elysia marginata]
MPHQENKVRQFSSREWHKFYTGNFSDILDRTSDHGARAMLFFQPVSLTFRQAQAAAMSPASQTYIIHVRAWPGVGQCKGGDDRSVIIPSVGEQADSTFL